MIAMRVKRYIIAAGFVPGDVTIEHLVESYNSIVADRK